MPVTRSSHQVPRAAPNPVLSPIIGSRCFLYISTSRHCQARTSNFSQSSDPKFQPQSCPWHTQTQIRLKFIKIGLQQIMNYHRKSHKYNCASITYFKPGKNTRTTWTIKYWPFDVVEMLTVDSGTKMDIAKMLHRNSMAGPDATYPAPQGWVATPWAPVSYGMVGCWHINSILANNDRKISIRILNQYPFLWKMLICA